MTDRVLWTGPASTPHRYQVSADSVAEVVGGGEGLVYRAHDTVRGVPVALKMLTAVSVADYGRIVERSGPFATITHPNLMAHAEVFIGTGLTDDPNPAVEDFDVIYSVADWIEGRPLPDVAESAGIRQLLGYVAGVARGLDALHRHRSAHAPLGIVHRDVKPSNVRVTPADCAVLIDFGVARPIEHGDLTQGVGTYRWRAPEVLSGSSAIGTAADVWGLGAVAFWALTGEPPSLDGASVAREQLIHAPRAQQLSDPVGVATHISNLLETSPTKRSVDLDRWATQLDSILDRRSRTTWRKPTAIGVAALLTIPSAAYVLPWRGNDRVDSEGTTTTATTTAPPTAVSTTPSTTSSTSVPASKSEGLTPATGDTWRVDCIGGGPESMIVTGADPGERIEAEVTWAAGSSLATDLEQEPLSYASGPGSVSSSGPTPLIADRQGSFELNWFCDRSQVGTPVALSMRGAQSGRQADIRIESVDLLDGLEVFPDTNWVETDGTVRVPVGTEFEVLVTPLLSDNSVVAARGLPTGLLFDPRMRLRSSDPSTLSIAEVPRGDRTAWIASANSPGQVILETELPGTPHTASLTVTVFELPAVPAGADGLYQPGALTSYLVDLLQMPATMQFVGDAPPADADPLPDIGDWAPYIPLLPACGDEPSFGLTTWTRAERIRPSTPIMPDTPNASFTIHTFASTAEAESWASALRQAIDARLGSDCTLSELPEPRRFESLTDVSAHEYLLAPPPLFSFTAWGLAAVTARNTVVVTLGFDPDFRIMREALGRAL